MKKRTSDESLLRVVFWGTYDTGKPRVRILLRGLRENGVEVIECHSEVWEGVEDKSQVFGWIARFRLLFKWLLRYPMLILRYVRLPKHDVIIVGYMGQMDILVIWPFAKDLAETLCKLIRTQNYGTYHASNKGECTWYDFTKKIFELASIFNVEVLPITTEQLGRPAKRPKYSVLRNYMLELTIGDEMRDWEEALNEYIKVLGT